MKSWEWLVALLGIGIVIYLLVTRKTEAGTTAPSAPSAPTTVLTVPTTPSPTLQIPSPQVSVKLEPTVETKLSPTFTPQTYIYQYQTYVAPTPTPQPTTTPQPAPTPTPTPTPKPTLRPIPRVDRGEKMEML